MAVRIGISTKKEDFNHYGDGVRFHFVYQDGKFNLKKEALFPEINKNHKGQDLVKQSGVKTHSKRVSKHIIFTNRKTRAILSFLIVASGALGNLTLMDPTLPAGIISAGFTMLTNSFNSSRTFLVQEFAEVQSFMNESVPPESIGLIREVTASLMVGQVPLLNAKLK